MAALLAIPVTIILLSDSQDLQQNADEAYIQATQITTIPEDTLKIDISEEDGTVYENTGIRKRERKRDRNTESGGQDGSGECTHEDITEQTEGGTKRTININCDGGEQFVDKSGSDGNQKIIESNKKVKKTDKDRNREGKRVRKNDRKSLIDRILERFNFRKNRDR